MIRIQVIILFLISLYSSAQPPQAIPFQAVARDASGLIIVNQNISIRIGIYSEMTGGLMLYQESHSVSTNQSGIFTLNIGQGSVLTGVFLDIDWKSGNKFVEVELDIAGGNNYIVIGRQQLLSVPYALYANDYPDRFKHYIGEFYGGGIVIYVYKSNGVEHGLIASLTNLTISTPWSNVMTVIGPNAQSLWHGLGNSNAIVGQAGHTNSAAKLCLDFVYTDITGTYSDWYLPALHELNIIYNNAFLLNTLLPTTGKLTSVYWSSTEVGTNATSSQSFFNGQQNSFAKTDGASFAVRAVRSF